jgi:hypothetical protein
VRALRIGGGRVTGPGNQRWRSRRASYVRPDSPIRTHEHEVAPIGREVARRFVVEHHYAGTFPAARWSFGLHRGAELVGVAVFSVPARDEVLTRVFPGAACDSTELGRFVLLDQVAGNGETWFLARCLDELRRAGVRGVVSFSDPLPRRALDGTLTMPGHVGTIYQASSAVYLGRARAEGLLLLPDGRSFPRRALAKIRAGHKGWRYSVRALLAAGAREVPACLAGDGPADLEELRAWLADWSPRLLRRVSHPGNHKYAFALDRRARKHIGPAVPAGYPKRVAT